MRSKKNIIRVWTLLFVLAMFCGLSLRAEAANKVKTLKAGKWSPKLSEKAYNTYYKIKVKSDCILKVKTKGDCVIGLLRKPSDDYNSLVEGVGYDLYYSKGYDYVGVAKGTYYLKAIWGASENAKFKYTLISAGNQKNTKAKKAKSLSAGKKVRIVQTKNNNYDRWYKVKLSGNKKIHIQIADPREEKYYPPYTLSFIEEAVTLYNSKLKEIKMKGKDSYDEEKEERTGVYTLTSKKVLKKGTYYIKISKKKMKEGTESSIMTFKWKKVSSK